MKSYNEQKCKKASLGKYFEEGELLWEEHLLLVFRAQVQAGNPRFQNV